MRLPVPIVVLLVLAVLAGVWFVGTRRMDFLRQPSAVEMEVLRQRAVASIPRSEARSGSARPTKPPVVDTRPPQWIQTRPESPAEVAERNPGLDTFLNLAPKGSRHLIELSTLVEASGDRQRTLMVWERVIDSTKPESIQLTAALAAVKRLRGQLPTWNKGHQPIPVVLRVHTPPKYQETLQPAVVKAAEDLSKASHGVLAVTPDLVVVEPPPPVVVKKKGSRSRRPARPVVPPVTLAVCGRSEGSGSTETVTLAMTKIKAGALADELLREAFKVVSSRLGADKSHRPVSQPLKNEPPLDSLSYRITRLMWSTLGRVLNLPKPPADAPKT